MKLKGVPLKVRWEVVECDAATTTHAGRGEAAAGAKAGIVYDLSENGGGTTFDYVRTSSTSRAVRSASSPGARSTRSPAIARRSAR